MYLVILRVLSYNRLYIVPSDSIVFDNSFSWARGKTVQVTIQFPLFTVSSKHVPLPLTQNNLHLKNHQYDKPKITFWVF